MQNPNCSLPAASQSHNRASGTAQLALEPFHLLSRRMKMLLKKPSQYVHRSLSRPPLKLNPHHTHAGQAVASHPALPSLCPIQHMPHAPQSLNLNQSLKQPPLTMTASSKFRLATAAASLLLCLAALPAPALQLDSAIVIQRVDAAVKNRIDTIAAYTVTEHYAVYRNNDEIHPVAEMTVKTTYRQQSGKSYQILSQSGSQLIRTLILGAILDNEKQLNEPGVREGAWFTSANYAMSLKPGGVQQVDSTTCLLLDIVPRRKAPYLIQGTLWVDANDGSIVQIQGVSSQSASIVTGPTQVVRQYAKVNGFSQATHARAESDSLLFGKTIVKIDYSGYQIQLRPTQ